MFEGWLYHVNILEKRSTKFPMAATLKWHQNHRYLSSFITVWILAPFLLFWFVMLILLTQCFGWFSKMNFKNQNNKKGAKIQTVMKELKYLWFWCHSNMAAIGYLYGGFSRLRPQLIPIEHFCCELVFLESTILITILIPLWFMPMVQQRICFRGWKVWEENVMKKLISQFHSLWD